MVAHFYLLAESFHNNATFSKVEIEEKLMRFSEDVNLINRYKKTNRLYVNYKEVYPQILYSTYSVEYLICCGHEKKDLIERDVLNALQNIFNKSTETGNTLQEVKKKLLPTCNADNCYGLVAFHGVNCFNNGYQIIYGKDEWYRFRRHILGLYPPTDNSLFIDECAIYFPALFFHERNKTEVHDLVQHAPQKLIHYLSELNDKFNRVRTNPYDRQKTLALFNSNSSFDQPASDEGNSGAKKKSKLKETRTFSFTNNRGEEVFVCCDLHLKMLRDDKKKVSTDRRIYFNEGRADVEDGKILVGHIGNHL